MAVYAITYDLHAPGQHYEKVADKIKSLGAWMKHFDSFWIVSTDSYSCSDIRDSLKSIVDSNDKILVAKLSGNWSTYNVSQSGIDWLNDRKF
jgi:hypothetical protein